MGTEPGGVEGWGGEGVRWSRVVCGGGRSTIMSFVVGFRVKALKYCEGEKNAKVLC